MPASEEAPSGISFDGLCREFWALFAYRSGPLAAKAMLVDANSLGPRPLTSRV